jgi:hypothetical protein
MGGCQARFFRKRAFKTVDIPPLRRQNSDVVKEQTTTQPETRLSDFSGTFVLEDPVFKIDGDEVGVELQASPAHKKRFFPLKMREGAAPETLSAYLGKMGVKLNCAPAIARGVRMMLFKSAATNSLVLFAANRPGDDRLCDWGALVISENLDPAAIPPLPSSPPVEPDVP